MFKAGDEEEADICENIRSLIDDAAMLPPPYEMLRLFRSCLMIGRSWEVSLPAEKNTNSWKQMQVMIKSGLQLTYTLSVF